MAIFHNESAFDHKLDSLKSSMKDFIEQLSERAADLKAKSVEFKDEAKVETKHAVAKVAAMIKKYPFAAIGIALGSGYLVAAIAPEEVMGSLATDLRARIAAHPWQAVAGAALVGAWFALEDPRERRHQLARLARATLRALVVRTGRVLVTYTSNVTSRSTNKARASA